MRTSSLRFSSSMLPVSETSFTVESGSRAARARVCFAERVESMPSSIVPSVTRMYTCTGLFWPILCARAILCSSTAGFHGRSTLTTVSAACRFSPVAPAFVAMKSAHRGSRWNRLTSACLLGLRHRAVQPDEPDMRASRRAAR